MRRTSYCVFQLFYVENNNQNTLCTEKSKEESDLRSQAQDHEGSMYMDGLFSQCNNLLPTKMFTFKHCPDFVVLISPTSTYSSLNLVNFYSTFIRFVCFFGNFLHHHYQNHNYSHYHHYNYHLTIIVMVCTFGKKESV